MFCGKCGAKNPDDAVVCGQCGARIGKEASQPMVIPVVRIGGKWYIGVENLGSIF